MKKIYILFTAFFLIFSASIRLYSENKQSFKKIHVYSTNNKIYLNSELNKDLSREIYQYLADGIKITLEYTVKIYKKADLK